MRIKETDGCIARLREEHCPRAKRVLSVHLSELASFFKIQSVTFACGFYQVKQVASVFRDRG